jgi:hypothetical protein
MGERTQIRTYARSIVRLTHRVIGPLKRLEGVLNRMADGEVVREVKFRDGDLIESFEKAFNRYLASLPAVGANPTGALASAQLPATAGKERDPSEPMDDEELVSVLHDLRKITGTGRVTPISPDRASANARCDRTRSGFTRFAAGWKRAAFRRLTNCSRQSMKLTVPRVT